MKFNSVTSKDFEIRRVFLAEDAENIRRMQSDAKVFIEHYPEHSRWLDMALSEVIRGKRIAFGVYKTLFDDRHRPAIELIGSIILKGNRFTGTAELKNLFIRDSDRQKGYGKALYEKAEDYCTKAGFLRIETEVPVSEFGTLGFLHSMGFGVLEGYSSPYRFDDRIYRMAKALPPRFAGDPFDLPAFSRWLLSHAFGFNDVHPDREPDCLLFAVSAKGIEPPKGSKIPSLLGRALIKDGAVQSNDLSTIFSKSSFDVGLLFCKEIAGTAMEMAEKLRIKTYDAATIRKEFAGLFAHRMPSFAVENVGGFVLNINAEVYGRIANQNVAVAALFKNGSVGKYLERGNKILIVSEPCLEHPLGGVKCAGIIDDVYVNTPSAVWNKYSESKPLFSKEEYDSYTRDKEGVLGLRVVNMQPITTIDYHVLLREIVREDFDLVELGCCYLSRDMLQRFDNARAVIGSTRPFKYDFVLSFAGEDRTHAEKLAQLLTQGGTSVFYDREHNAKFLGEDVYQRLASIYRDEGRFCIVFISKHYKENSWTNHELKQAQASRLLKYG